jgi:CelD/BcsL family acetyltransferase involved in cellulose biosynthesis
VNLHVEVVESLSALEAIAPAWRALDEQTSPRLPFTGPRWNLLWWKHFAKARLTVADRINSFLFFDGSQLVAVAPMMITERPAVGILRTRNLQFFGADPNVTEVRSLCCKRDDEGRVFEALLSHLEAHHNKWDWVELSGFVEQGPAYDAMARRKPLKWTRQLPDFLIHPGNDWEAYKSSLPRNLKESLRKCYANLRRDNLRYELRVAEQPGDVLERLETFFTLHSLRAQAPITPKHADVFETRTARSFLREYLAQTSEAGSAKLFELLVNDEVVASRIAFTLGDSLFLYFSGYQPTMSKYSVMTTCMAEAIKWAIANGFNTVNLSTGRDQSKLRWRPTEVPLIEVQWASPSWRGPVLHRFAGAVKKRATEAAASQSALRSFVRIVQRLRD